MAQGRRLTTTTKAVVLAGGLGTRMQSADPAASVTIEQQAAADTGVKGMIPLARPFLEYAISALADAGITDVCLVIGPRHDSVRRHFEHDVRTTRVRILSPSSKNRVGARMRCSRPSVLRRASMCLS